MVVSQASEILARYTQVQESIAQAAISVNRNPEDIRLLVVTKGHSLQAVQAAIEAGITSFGENYADEGISKMLAFQQHTDLAWHMIGHVQSRKARLVSEHFAWIHSLDSLKLAERLDRYCGELDRQMPVLFEMNVSGEETKFGLAAWDELEWQELIKVIEPILELHNLQVKGLMTMAPYFADPERARPSFKRLKRLQVYLQNKLPEVAWNELSMGMSGDYEVAVQEGATVVRIGTAIMGERYCKLEVVG